jgi:hypothetical protein
MTRLKTIQLTQRYHFKTLNYFVFTLCYFQSWFRFFRPKKSEVGYLWNEFGPILQAKSVEIRDRKWVRSRKRFRRRSQSSALRVGRVPGELRGPQVVGGTRGPSRRQWLADCLQGWWRKFRFHFNVFFKINWFHAI